MDFGLGGVESAVRPCTRTMSGIVVICAAVGIVEKEGNDNFLILFCKVFDVINSYFSQRKRS